MPGDRIYTPQQLDALIAIGLQARRAKLMRTARRQRILSRVAFGLSGLIALGVPTAYLAGDPMTARSIAVIFCITFSFTYFAGKAGRKQVLDSLQALDKAT